MMALLLGGHLPAEPEAAPERHPGAEALWEDFAKNYTSLSLEPLPAADLDLKAREALLSALGTRYRSWKPDKAATLPGLANAVSKADPALSPFELVEKALVVLLPSIDRYGRYEASSELAQMKEASRQSGGKIGMNIEIDEGGHLRCFPEPDGPADQAGVNHGAELLEVDGQSVERKPLAAVNLAFISPAPTVAVKVRQPQGKEDKLTITRTTQVFPAVTSKKGPAGLTVRIRHFDAGAAASLKTILTENKPVNRLVLDLRGNHGGLYNEAMLCASLFFPEKTVLGHLKDREGDHVSLDGNGVFAEPQSIQILMDRGSASGSELLAACLRENMADKVKIYGDRSYGKSHVLERQPIYGGGAMTVTTALMTTASGQSWDKTGLKPDVLQQSNEKTAR